MTTKPPSEDHPEDVASALMAIVGEMRESRTQQHEDQMKAMGDLTTAVGAVKGVVTDLRVAVVGDAMGNPGLIKRQNTLQAAIDEERAQRVDGDKRTHTRIDQEARRTDKMLWTTAGIAIGAGISGGGLFALLSNIAGGG